MTICVMIVLFVVCANFSISDAKYYYIIPSLNVSCPQEPCLTLSQFATNISQYDGNNSDVTLSFQSGNHSLAIELSVANVGNFSMITGIQDDDTAFIRCVGRSGRFHVRDSTFVWVKGLHFIGCGSNKIVKVKKFILEDATFLGVSLGWWGSLVLNRIANASIIRNSFLLNSCTTYYIGHGGAIYATDSSFSVVDSYFANISVAYQGGVVYSRNSEFIITSSKFANNRAPKGGVIYSSSSLFNISNSSFVNNSASCDGSCDTLQSSSSRDTSAKGGVLYATVHSSFSITFSIFIRNRADNEGGVLYVENYSLFDITTSIFTHNNASKFGGIMYIYESSFNFTNNTVEYNAALLTGAVMCISQSSFTCNIIASTFAKNYAYSSAGVIWTRGSRIRIVSSIFVENNASRSNGGVLYLEYQTSLFISTSKFTHNSAGTDGGVMYIDRSSSTCNIIASTFTKNYASVSGGVMRTHRSRIRIVSSIFVENIASRTSGGVLYLAYKSSLFISTSKFTHNSAGLNGGVIFMIEQSSSNVINSTFVMNNASNCGGAICIDYDSSFSVAASNFMRNRASYGGAVFTDTSSLSITATNFTENRASYSGGALYVQLSFCGITSSKFFENGASYGAVLFLHDISSLHILSSTFDGNKLSDSKFDSLSSKCSGKVIATLLGNKLYKCSVRGGVIASAKSSFTIASCSFTNNRAVFGVVNALYSSFTIINSVYAHNHADIGGVISAFNASFNISTSLFSNNRAKVGGVAGTLESSFRIIHSNFINNRADFDGGVMYIVSEGAMLKDYMITIANSTFSKNKSNYGGIMYITGTTIDIINSKFYQNVGSFYVFSSNVTFRGVTKFENCTEPPSRNNSQVSRREGGAITSYHSTVIFTGESTLLHNQARKGGAIYAIDSEIIMWGETTIANNEAINGSGGGIYLIICDFVIQGKSNIIQNHASEKGGGIEASGSSIMVQQQGVLRFTNNSAEYGGGAYLKISSRLVTFSKFPGIWSKEDENGHIEFVGNFANYGGAIYISDNNSVSCSFHIECLVQSVSFNKLLSDITTVNRLITFSGNTAAYHGSNIFGGLFDRCIPSPFATVYTNDIDRSQHYYSGLSYLQNISNITLDSIASYPVRVCFCDGMDQPDCSYEMPTIRVKKGEAFNVSIAAVDQVNHSINASIRGVLINNASGRMDEGQQLQVINNICTRLTYNVFSPAHSEILMLFADGPCMGSPLSGRNVNIQFLDCTCSIGFQRSQRNSTCECICNSTLSPYVSNCNSTTNSILRGNMNSWIAYTNDTDPPGFIIHPFCPLDYCYPPDKTISINLNFASGSDAQCAHNRSGMLCGACQLNLSLSLSSSRCLSCPNHWALMFISIILASLIAGILLVTVVLVLNMTVADGMINAIIFYANVTAPFDRTIHSSAAPSFPTVFVAWLNLDVGFDVCFFNGLNVYAKTWLQLLFPVYIISLVAMVIKISEYSPRFTRLISSRRRDPVATLATLILLSYAKLLSTTISVLSFVTLIYPDGSKSVVWLVDGNVQYFRGKHIVLVIIAALIVLIGVPYTFLLFSWQWLIRIPKVKFNRWIRLNSIITAYHAPYNNSHRYWTGLLLLVRIVLYITVAVTVSNNPQIPLLMTIILVGGLLFLRKELLEQGCTNDRQ